MRKKKVHHEEHPDESWLIPYADMLTLVLALFIVMFAMSEIDKVKLQQMSTQFSAIFSSGGGITLQSGNSAIGANPLPVSPSSGESPSTLDNRNTEDKEMKAIKETLEKEMKANGFSDNINIALDAEGLDISIESAILFDPGSGEVVKNIHPPLLEICNSLKRFENEIVVAGYTDNVPIRTAQFRSNWELSAIRAINVMNFMVESGKLNPKLLSIRAYGEYKPKYDNGTETGRAKNRRVEIFIARKYN